MQAIAAGLAGLQQADKLLNQTASRLAQLPLSARASQDSVSLSGNAVALLQARNSYQANLDSVKVADEMQRSTLSLLA